MHPDKMEAPIHRIIKNVNISLDQSKKTISHKVCTLTSLGLHTRVRNGPARIVEKPLVLQLYARQSQGGANDAIGYKKP